MNGEKLKYLKQLQNLYDDEVFLSLSNVTDKNHSIKSQIDNVKSSVCKKCDSSNIKKTFVFGSPQKNTSLMLIGETLDQEDLFNGEPIFEQSYKLLDKMLQSIGMSRNNDVFICEVLKDDLPLYREPKKIHKIECEHYLINQIDLIQPKLIVVLGKYAAKTLLGVEKSLKELRGEIYKYHSKSLIITYHPAELLRNSKWKSESWQDLKWTQELLKKN